MTKKIIYILSICTLLFSFMACEEEDKEHYFEQGWHLKLKGYKTSKMQKIQPPRPSADSRYYRMNCTTDGDVSGRNEMNTFTAKYSLNGNGISFSEVKSTNSESIYEDEYIILNLLRQVNRFKSDGKYLYMYVLNQDNVLIYETYKKISVVESKDLPLTNNSSLKAEAKAGEIYRANSKQEFEELMKDGGREVDLSNVDFEKEMILLIKVTSNENIKIVKSQLTKWDQHYEWSLFVEQGSHETLSEQTVAIVTNILTNEFDSKEPIIAEITYSQPVNRN